MMKFSFGKQALVVSLLVASCGVAADAFCLPSLVPIPRLHRALCHQLPFATIPVYRAMPQKKLRSSSWPSSSFPRNDMRSHQDQVVKTRVSTNATPRQQADSGEGEEVHECVVRCAPGEPNLTVELNILGKQRILSRMQEDPLSSTIERLKKLFTEKGKYGAGGKKKKKVKGKGKKRQKQAETEPEAAADSATPQAPAEPKIWVEDADGAAVASDLTNKEAWKHGRRLRVDQRTFTVLENIPTVSVQLRQPAISGFALQPTYSVEFGKKEDTRWRWFAAPEPEEGEEEEDLTEDQMELVAEGEAWFVPGDEQVGRRIFVEVSAFREESGNTVWGRSELVECEATVRDAPDLSVFDARVQHVHRVQQSGRRRGLLRLVSYNILADNYANTPFAREQLYHYCPAQFLNVDFRKQLVVWELLQYDADIICLQEVARDVYDAYLEPQLKRGGLVGTFMNKISGSNIGCAVFYASSSLELMAQHCVDLTQGWSKHPDLKALCEGDNPVAEKMTRAITRSTTIGQVCVFRKREASPSSDSTSDALVVANTHLFGHPDAAHVRLVQAVTLCRAIEDINRRLPFSTRSSPAVVFCGDLNSRPEEALRELMRKGKISAEHPDWWRSSKFQPIDSRAEREAAWFDREDPPPDSTPAESGRSPVSADLHVALQLAQGCTNVELSFCTDGNAQLVDYVYYTPEQLPVDEDSAPFPAFSEQQIKADTGLPSRRFPSDHISLVQDFSWPPPP